MLVRKLARPCFDYVVRYCSKLLLTIYIAIVAYVEASIVNMCFLWLPRLTLTWVMHTWCTAVPDNTEMQYISSGVRSFTCVYSEVVWSLTWVVICSNSRRTYLVNPHTCITTITIFSSIIWKPNVWCASCCFRMAIKVHITVRTGAICEYSNAIVSNSTGGSVPAV